VRRPICTEPPPVGENIRLRQTFKNTMAWKELHIFTVGASPVLNPARRLMEDKSPLVEEEPLLAELRALPPHAEEQEKVESWAEPNSRVFKELLRVIEEDPRWASAELNAYYGFRETAQWGETARILLFHTDTGVGKLAATLLYEYLKRHSKIMGVSHTVEPPRRIEGFGLGPDHWDDALADTVAKIGGAAAEGKRRGYRVFLNATGGFKPEVSFALVVALLAGIDEAYYIHEAARRIVFLPRIPVTLDEELASLLKRLDGLAVGDINIDDTVLRARGYTPEDLEKIGVAEIREGRLVLKRWARLLLESQP